MDDATVARKDPMRRAGGIIVILISKGRQPSEELFKKGTRLKCQRYLGYIVTCS